MEEFENDDILKSDVVEEADIIGETDVIEETDSLYESSGLSAEDVKSIVDSSLDEYFMGNAIQIMHVGDDLGIHKDITSFTLTETCLVIIVMILLGKSILNIIGGRAWGK